MSESDSSSGRPGGPEWYDGTSLEVTEGFVRYYRWLLDLLKDSIRGRTLEFGAGTGTMSARIAPVCSELVLVEPATNLHAALEPRFAREPGVSVHRGTLQEVAESEPAVVSGGFDTVASFNVLEHIEDDAGTLRVAGTLLRPGGRVVAMVPALPCLYGAVDAEVHHVRRYTRGSMTQAVADAGLEVERIEYFDFLGMIPWFIFGRLLRRSAEGVGVGAYDRFVIPVCRAFDRLVGPPIGKSLIVVARRAEGRSC